MRAVARDYWIKAVAVSVIAFVLGMSAYVFAGIAMAHQVQNANADSNGWQQISVSPILCECVVKFAPDPPLPGEGTVDDPFTTHNSKVTMVVGAAGIGTIAIVDGNGNELWSYNKATMQYEDIIATINFGNVLGLHELYIQMEVGGDLTEVGPNVEVPVYIEYLELPGPGPEVPETGLPNWFIGGYAVKTMGMLLCGLLLGLIAFLIFFLVAMKRRKDEKDTKSNNKKMGRSMSRAISPREMAKSGIGVKRTKKK